MFQVKAPQPNGVLSRYQPNSSHLHKAGVHTEKPPLPLTKPPSRISSHIPTRMQNLEPSVVNKFLQAVNGNSPESDCKTSNSISEHSSKFQGGSAANNNCSAINRRKDNSPKCTENSKEVIPPWLNRNTGNTIVQENQECNSKISPSRIPSNVPTWAAKRNESPKATWNSKPLDKPAPVWSAKNSGFTETTPAKNSPAWVPHKNESTRETPEWMANRNSLGSTDWKNKYEEAERKRKELLVESQKAEREKVSLERRLTKLENEHKQLQAEHQEKSGQLSRLSKVSEKVYQDYDELNKKYEVETSALHRALGAASKWYMENKKLRRESVARGANSPSPLDEPDGDDQDELEELRKTVQDLSQQVGHLQSELNRAKLLEFETQEQLVNLNQQLGDERAKSQRQEKELKELKLMREKFESVTMMVQGEVETLRQQRDQAIVNVGRFQAEAHQAKTERNVLAHQSSLLMGDITPEDRLVKVLLEVEDLKRLLEDEKHQHQLEMSALQERLEEGESDSRIELLEEKLHLAESELQLALERAEQAEQLQIALKMKVEKLENEKGAIPCAPPPPPPPPMPTNLGGMNQPIRKPIRRPTEGDSLEDMARLLGIQRTAKQTQPTGGGAIDNIINEIKGGKFTLKATEKAHSKKEEPPPAVQEMLSIIGTLKRRSHKPILNH